MSLPAKRRFPWGVLTLAFAAAAVVFLLAAVALSNSDLFPSEVVRVTPTVAQATATVGTGTPQPNPTATPTLTSPGPSAPPQSLWPPSANTITDVLAIMGGISSIGTLLSFFGLLGRGASTILKRARRRVAS
jgi:hypothetical protein